MAIVILMHKVCFTDELAVFGSEKSGIGSSDLEN
jgi:hypothetical protein